MPSLTPSLLAVTLLCATDCRPSPPSALDGPPQLGAAATTVEFTNATFEDLYPIFLTREVMARGPKAALWQEHQGKWVRWTGKLVSFSPNGITLRHRAHTVTFDVSLFMDGPVRAQLPGDYHLGDRVTYVGALDSYDDIFRTLYLVHGRLVEKLPPAPLDSP